MSEETTTHEQNTEYPAFCRCLSRWPCTLMVEDLTAENARARSGAGSRVRADGGLSMSDSGYASAHGAAKRQRPAHWPPGVDSELEMSLLTRLERHGLPLGVGQHRFVPGRQYRFDRAWISEMVAVELQGGLWVNGAHSRGSGVERDCLKLSIAAALGWRVLPISRAMVESGEAVRLIAQALGLEALETLEANIKQANDRLDWIESRGGKLPDDNYALIETVVGVVRALRGVKLGRTEG